MRRLTVSTVALVLVLGTSCSTMTVRTDWDTGAEFSDYESFAWLDRGDRPRGPRKGSPLVHQRIERAVSTELAAKGYAETGVRRSDLVVTHYLDTQKRVRVSHSGYYRYGRAYRWGGWGTTRVHHYSVGTLVVDVVDRSSKQLVWRGIAEGAFSKPNPSDEKVAKVVKRLLDEFPPA